MDLLLFWPLWSLLSHTHTNTRTRTHARSTKQYFFMESCVAWAAPSASASASRHALHLCPVRGLEAYYPLSSKWPHVPALRLSTSSHLLSETGSVSRNRQKKKRKEKKIVPTVQLFSVVAHYAWSVGTALSTVRPSARLLGGGRSGCLSVR